MMHLTADELKTWYEQGRADDRERVIGHLADCEGCRRSLSALAMSAEPDTAARPLVTTAEAVPLGYAARKTVPSTQSWAAWLRPAYGLAGAAVLVLAVVWLTTPRGGDRDDAVRSTELLALTPSGETGSVQFKWESPFDAASYRVSVRDAMGVLVISLTTRESQAAPDASMRARLIAGETYAWQVAALDAAGDPIAESRPVTFRYQP
jgi:hypothetical protein